MLSTPRRYKVFVVAFPEILERLVFFRQSPDDDVAVIKEGHGRDDPYVGEHYTPPIERKAGEWFWEYHQAKAEWYDQRNARVESVCRHLVRLQDKLTACERATIDRDSVKSCGCALPDGKDGQLAHYRERDVLLADARKGAEIKKLRSRLADLEEDDG